MTFDEIAKAIGEGMGLELAVVDDTTAVRLGERDGGGVEVVLRGFDERGGMLLTADLGEPPPERLERLFKAMLEANDLFRDTGGATLSIDPATGRARLQRYDDYEAWSAGGGGESARLLAFFAQCAAAWAGIVRDFRDGGASAAEAAPPLGNLSGIRV